MESLARLFVAFLELIEAEARNLKRQVLRLGLGFVFLFVGGFFLTAGGAFFLYAIYRVLAIRLGDVPALCATGVASVFFALALFALAFGGSKTSTAPAQTQENRESRENKENTEKTPHEPDDATGS